MRNETVERIVNLLFQDVEMTDEVQALYDETMSNCQERYQDMTSRGLSDDDAIAAVVESLKGMEDVISQYPKKSEAPEAEEAPKSAEVPVDDGGDGEQTDFTFHPADIGRIEMTMVCDDVHLEESPDDDLHVLFEDAEGAKASICRIEDGVLRVCRDPDAPKQLLRQRHFRQRQAVCEEAKRRILLLRRREERQSGSAGSRGKSQGVPAERQEFRREHDEAGFQRQDSRSG